MLRKGANHLREFRGGNPPDALDSNPWMKREKGC